MQPPCAIREASSSDARVAVEVMLASRHANLATIPALVHAEDEVRDWFSSEVMASCDVVVACQGDEIVGVLVLDGGWIDQLYVLPERTSCGIGAQLLREAKGRSGGVLDLWTFVSNTRACRFYERHGFVAVGATDGDNEEGVPDVHYRWRAETD